MATRGATVQVRPTPGRTAKLVLASSDGRGSRRQLVEEVVVEIELVERRSGDDREADEQRLLADRCRRRPHQRPHAQPREVAARADGIVEVGAEPAQAARRRPILSSGSAARAARRRRAICTSLSVGLTNVTVPPTLTRPLVWASRRDGHQQSRRASRPHASSNTPFHEHSITRRSMRPAVTLSEAPKCEPRTGYETDSLQ